MMDIRMCRKEWSAKARREKFSEWRWFKQARAKKNARVIGSVWRHQSNRILTSSSKHTRLYALSSPVHIPTKSGRARHCTTLQPFASYSSTNFETALVFARGGHISRIFRVIHLAHLDLKQFYQRSICTCTIQQLPLFLVS